MLAGDGLHQSMLQSSRRRMPAACGARHRSMGAVLLLPALVLGTCLGFVGPRFGAHPYARRGHLSYGRGHCSTARMAESYVEKCEGSAWLSDAISATKGEEGPDVVMLSFSTTWCGPCKLMDPYVSELSRMFKTTARFIKVIGDQDPDGMDIMKQEGVRSVPQYHIYKDGVKVETVMGAKRDVLEEALMKYAPKCETWSEG
mmetsp:Transcript_57582/g.136935  ORF Transcript_57582/g.136935 Transcript_57582/m.136935 type:complete len:201 (+) Transcript_57582:48-650(+)